MYRLFASPQDVISAMLEQIRHLAPPVHNSTLPCSSNVPPQ